jgi:hypothetical protein
MATAPAKPALRMPALGIRGRRAVSAPALCALGLGAAVAYAAFADGAITLPNEARLQVGIAAVALFALAALLFAPRMRIATSAAGWAGLGVLALFAAWTGSSFAWSIAPDGTWAELNRALAYTLVVALALLVGSSAARALERAALGYLAIAGAVALYALGGKAAPGLHVGALDLNHTEFFSRLRAPLAYWNALSLFCVLAVPIAIRAAGERDRVRPLRAVALVVLVLLLTTAALTYSRGGFAALVVALAVLLAIGPERVHVLFVTAAGALGAAPALAVGFAREDLTSDLVPVAQRTGDGLMFAAALVAGCAVALFAVMRLESHVDRLAAVRVPRRRVFALAAAGVAAALVIALAALAASSRGIGGSVSHGLDSFKSVKYERQNDPARILQTNSGNRWVWWREAAGAFSDRPLEGWGAGSFPLLHHRYRRNSLEVLQPHSVPLQFLAEIGLVGALLAGAALALLGVAAGGRVAAGRRSERAGIPAGREHRYATALAAAGIAWLVHIWFDWDWDIPGVTAPFFAFAGLLAARPLGRPGLALAPPRRGAVIGPRLAALILGAALLCAVAVSAALPSLAHDHTQLATSALARGDLVTAAREADTARRLDPVAVDALLLDARVASIRRQLGLASSLLTEAIHRQPDNPSVWLGVARLELARADIPAMRAAARRALELDPVGAQARLFFLANDLGVRSASATATPLPGASP